jgi:hypothetical protein
MGINLTPSMKSKLLAKHPPVYDYEVDQCFANRTGKDLIDKRAEHETDPPTLWFIAETNSGRKLKIVYIPFKELRIKTAYEPNADELRIYEKYGTPIE